MELEPGKRLFVMIGRFCFQGFKDDAAEVEFVFVEAGPFVDRVSGHGGAFLVVR